MRKGDTVIDHSDDRTVRRVRGCPGRQVFEPGRGFGFRVVGTGTFVRGCVGRNRPKPFKKRLCHGLEVGCCRRVRRRVCDQRVAEFLEVLCFHRIDESSFGRRTLHVVRVGRRRVFKVWWVARSAVLPDQVHCASASAFASCQT